MEAPVNFWGLYIELKSLSFVTHGAFLKNVFQNKSSLSKVFSKRQSVTDDMYWLICTCLRVRIYLLLHFQLNQKRNVLLPGAVLVPSTPWYQMLLDYQQQDCHHKLGSNLPGLRVMVSHNTFKFTYPKHSIRVKCIRIRLSESIPWSKVNKLLCSTIDYLVTSAHAELASWPAEAWEAWSMATRVDCWGAGHKGHPEPLTRIRVDPGSCHGYLLTEQPRWGNVWASVQSSCL